MLGFLEASGDVLAINKPPPKQTNLPHKPPPSNKHTPHFDSKSITSELAAVGIHDRVDPVAFDEELVVIERDMMAVAVDFDDRGNEIEDDPALEDDIADFDRESPDADHQD